jgi:hypothetical protein
MHALLADLLPWIVAFYLVDCLAQPGRGHLLLAAGLGRLRPLRAGLHLVGLSPIGEVVALFDLPYLLAPGQVYLPDLARRSEPPVFERADLAPLAIEALTPVVREGRRVKGGGWPLLAAPTPEEAERLRAALATLAAGGPPDPDADASRRDLAAARALRVRQRPYLLALRGLAVLLAGAVFAVGPLVAWGPFAARVPAGLLFALAGALLVSIAAATTAMLVACGEGAGRSLRAGAHLLLPWAALHPLAHASRALYRRFDALTAAAALLEPADFHRLAARELVRARISRARTPAELGPAWEDRERLIAGLLAATGSSAAVALAPPRRAPGAAAYCPLCRTAYRAGFEACADCGVPLLPFDRAA